MGVKICAFLPPPSSNSDVWNHYQSLENGAFLKPEFETVLIFFGASFFFYWKSTRVDKWSLLLLLFFTVGQSCVIAFKRERGGKEKRKGIFPFFFFSFRENVGPNLPNIERGEGGGGIKWKETKCGTIADYLERLSVRLF